jgi:hypothetical protein
MKPFWVVVVLAVSALAFAGDKNKDKDKDRAADVTITVLKAYNGKPVRNAAVVLHAVNSKGKQEAGGLNLKTNEDGVATYSGIPYGMLRIQVIVPGLQTYGEDAQIDQPEKQIVVKMQPPQKQYSIYEHGAKPADIDPDKH